MVSSCCICSREDTRLETRSFHRIPANEEMKKKWFHIIGRTVSYKGARVCSDHFTEDDYTNINPYSKVRRLKNTAVPSVILQKKKKVKRQSSFQKIAVNLYNSEIISENEEAVTFCKSDNLEINANNDTTEIKESENVNNELILTQDASENFIIFLNSEKINVACIDNQEVDANFENNMNNISKERELSSPNLANSKTRKVFLKLSKYNTICFTRTDFSSDKKWTEFLKCITYRRRENKIIRRRNKCLQKKILIFQDMLQDLLKKV
ncbi:uncharacterized protein LOC105838256 [Monomorium pharaonis]|uniref:uncharacterized protein LOC105838256 n=1 Tax=Monomorium pharaonis TaxID=307658 RepID=UPI00063EF6EB|nr:uncharacterized protein LOC105838256 [Monomorium pharaonis]XP_012539141.1 uncharacterized protein LOC105838256 [Monomorium pharaonis]XP_028046697.1 uncharacterized protein LOC105838256 [Monomorium pharaonis]